MTSQPLTGITRRRFVKGLAGAGLIGLIPTSGCSAFAESESQPSRPMRLLILGGTGFIGPHQVEYAVQRGHQVSVFNRGRTDSDLPDGVEYLIGDRNDDLEALRGREWDVVIDNPTTLPVWVRDAASLLAGNVGQYIFVSTISVYADNSVVYMDESGPLLEYQGADPMAETMESFQANLPSLYGPLKVLAEREAEKYFPGQTTVVRPGLIVGPGDPTDRFTYWPVRVARGGTVLAPGTPQDPVQVIDARDLSQWIIRLAENRTVGTFNATGPIPPLTMGRMLDSMRPLADRPVDFAFASADFLADHGVQPWSHMPTWVPPTGESAGFSRLDVSRAVAAGLTYRPIGQTAADTLEWFRTLPPERQAQLRAGITADREAQLLADLA